VGVTRAFGELRAIISGTSIVTPTPDFSRTPLPNIPVVANPTDTPVPTGIAQVKPTVEVFPSVPPPPGYPKDQPWPPIAPTQKPAIEDVVITATPLPSGAAVPPPSSAPPVELGAVQPISADVARSLGSARLVFPYSASVLGKPTLRVATLNQAGADVPVKFDADLPIDISGVASGASLTHLFLSPDGNWLVAQKTSHVSADFELISLTSRSAQSLKSVEADHPIPMSFLAWSADSKNIVIQTASESTASPIVLVNLATKAEKVIDYPQTANGLSRMVAVAFSPTEPRFADAVLNAETLTLELALRPATTTDMVGRRVIKQFTNVAELVERSLVWSPDGKKLAWVMNVQTGNSYKIDTQQTELWVADLSTSEFKRIAILGKRMSYEHIPLWGANSQEVVALVTESVKDQRDETNNIKRFNIRTGAVQNLTDFKTTHLTNLGWSRDGLQLTFSLLKEGSRTGEIWVTDLQGKQKNQLVTLTPPNAPYVWLP
jgi:Tol biopolymer transport system component